MDLEEIIKLKTNFITESNEYLYNIHDLKVCMKEACYQILELAAKNAEVSYLDWHHNSQRYETIEVDKQSILNIINQIK